MDATLSDPLVDRLLDGRYAIEARLARGGMASVYLATDVRLERRVAVKVMHAALAEDPDFVARFNREARAAARLSHPAAVSVYDQGTDDGHVFLVMEYVAGATLRDILRDRGRLSPAEAVAVMDHVLAALGAAHAAGLVHRDVKPENVLVTPDGRVKVADFGLARAMAGTTLTGDDGMLLGTAAYISPEQVRDGTADTRSDVYSAGVMFFELLTGSAPFTADTPLSVAYKHMSDDVPAPSSRASGIPAELDQIVQAATARDPMQRPADGRALHIMLSQVRQTLGLHGAVPAPPSDNTINIVRDDAPPAGPDEQRTAALPSPSLIPEQAEEPREPRRWPFVLVAVLVLSIIAGVGGWWLAVGRYTHAPRVLGLGYQVAAAKIDDAGLHAKSGTGVYSETVPKGHVVSQDPSAGTKVHRGETVTLHLSRGPEIVTVPDVKGKTEKAALRVLEKADIPVDSTDRIYSTTVAKDHVIRTDPPGGTDVHAGKGVVLVVSKGPQPVKVPDVTNKTYDEAESMLSAVGLVAERRDVFDDKVPAGKVVSTFPAARETAHDGDTVTVNVSKGPRLVPVPNVVGKKIQDAIKTINEAGFRADPRQIFSGGPGKVVRQKPSGMAPPGSTIELDYY